jgi:hypothetical protein
LYKKKRLNNANTKTKLYTSQKSFHQTLRSLVSNGTVVASREANSTRAGVASLVTDGTVVAVVTVVVVVAVAGSGNDNGGGCVHVGTVSSSISDSLIGGITSADASNDQGNDEDEDKACVTIYNKVWD